MTHHPGYPGPPQERVAPRAKREKRNRRLERRPSEFGAPRRYGIGTIMIVTLAAAVLLGVFNAFGAPPVLVVVVMVFLVLVGLGQIILYQGVRPRAASVLTGAIVFPLEYFLIFVFFAVKDHRGWRGVADPVEVIVFGCILLVVGPILGAGLGYVAGGLVAGIFLVMDAVQRALEKPIQAELVSEDSPSENSPENSPQGTIDQSPDPATVHPLDR